MNEEKKCFTKIEIPDKHFPDPETKTVMKCHSTCVKCSGPGFNQCL